MRIRIFGLIIIVAFLVLLSGLAFIQLGRHEKYRTMSEENRLKIVPLMAPRGRIFDRKGKVLVRDVLSFNVSVIYSRVKDKKGLAATLSPVLGMSSSELLKNIKNAKKQPYTPLPIARDIGLEKAIEIEEMGVERPGLLLEVTAKRRYIFGKIAGNLLGYLGYINRSEFKRLKSYGYRVNDLVGRDGLEEYYDEYLRGQHGGKQVEVDHRGREIMTLGYKEPLPGRDINLTLDIDLQIFCEELMEGKKGGILAMDPRTGAVRTMVSAPSYDPGAFIDVSRRKEVSEILKDKEYPLMNRIISGGGYPPGSVFKIVVACAALEEKAVSETQAFTCHGFITLGKRKFHCWKKAGHGPQTLKEALKNSCNVYFWRTGMALGVDNIAKASRKFGIGERTGIDLPGETKGLLPSREWKKKALKEKWYKGETMNYSVGQGYLLCSPIQIGRMVSVIANGGYLVKPYLVSRVAGVPVNTSDKVTIGYSPATIDTVKQGMKKVVNDKRGTGMKARLEKVTVAGKTGTAQTGRGKNHGWFAGFAPYKSPSLVVVVFDEFGGKGGYYAAETAGMVFEKAYELGMLDEERGGSV